jgi:hypothetical protein
MVAVGVATSGPGDSNVETHDIEVGQSHRCQISITGRQHVGVFPCSDRGFSNQSRP